MVEVSFSEDMEWLTIGASRWRLTGDIQQYIIKQLVDAFPTGKPLKTLKVLAEAGSNSDTIAKAFNKSPNWPTLSPYISIDDGTCRLMSVPVENSASSSQDKPSQESS